MPVAPTKSNGEEVIRETVASEYATLSSRRLRVVLALIALGSAAIAWYSWMSYHDSFWFTRSNSAAVSVSISRVAGWLFLLISLGATAKSFTTKFGRASLDLAFFAVALLLAEAVQYLLILKWSNGYWPTWLSTLPQWLSIGGWVFLGGAAMVAMLSRYFRSKDEPQQSSDDVDLDAFAPRSSFTIRSLRTFDVPLLLAALGFGCLAWAGVTSLEPIDGFNFTTSVPTTFSYVTESVGYLFITAALFGIWRLLVRSMGRIAFWLVLLATLCFSASAIQGARTLHIHWNLWYYPKWQFSLPYWLAAVGWSALSCGALSGVAHIFRRPVGTKPPELRDLEIAPVAEGDEIESELSPNETLLPHMSRRTKIAIATVAALAIVSALVVDSIRPSTGWSKGTVGSVGVWSVSCTASTFCAAIDLHGNGLTFDGKAWSTTVLPHSRPDGPGSHISCISRSMCIGTMGDGRTVKFDGTNWSIGPSINSQQPDFSDISCVSQNFCMEVGGGVAALFNGNAWTHPTSIDGSNFLESVSCATVGQCLAIDSQDNALIYRNGSWGKPEAIPGLKRAGLNSISCPSINFCMAVADGGAAVFNGTKWARIKMGRDRKLWFVSCASPTSCAAVGLSSAAIYDGAKFSKERDIDSPYPLVGISCTKSSFCMAIDPTGQYLTRRLRSGSGS